MRYAWTVDKHGDERVLADMGEALLVRGSPGSSGGVKRPGETGSPVKCSASAAHLALSKQRPSRERQK